MWVSQELGVWSFLGKPWPKLVHHGIMVSDNAQHKPIWCVLKLLLHQEALSDRPAPLREKEQSAPYHLIWVIGLLSVFTACVTVLFFYILVCNIYLITNKFKILLISHEGLFHKFPPQQSKIKFTLYLFLVINSCQCSNIHRYLTDNDQRFFLIVPDGEELNPEALNLLPSCCHRPAPIW